MKALKTVSGAVLLAVAACPVAAAPQVVKQFPTPSGRVVYRMINTGAMAMSSTMTITWSNYGQKFRQDMQMHMNPGGMAGIPKGAKMRSMNINSWTIYDGQYVYGAMPGAHKAMRLKLPQSALNSMASGIGGLNGMAGGVSASGGKVIGHAMLLGKPAAIRVITVNTPQVSLNAKMWMWGNLPLRAETAMKFKPMAMPANARGKNAPRSFQRPPMNMTMTATNLDANFNPSPNLFRVPAGYVVQDMGDLQKRMQKMGIGRAPRR